MTSFAGVPIDYSASYCEARRLMGDKTTDLDRLFDTVTLLYLNCPEEYVSQYGYLIKELMSRKTFIETGLWII